MTLTVHVLAYGRAFCGSVHGIPAGWGPGHRWVSAFGADWRRDATCALCRKVAELLHVVRRINYGERHEQMLPPSGPVEEETECAWCGGPAGHPPFDLCSPGRMQERDH